MVKANGTNTTLKRTPRQLEQDQKRQAIVDRILELRPDSEFQVNSYTTDLVYYTATVVKGKIKVERGTRSIYINDNPELLAAYKYRTKSEVENAINLVMPNALKRFDMCYTSFKQLTNELQFSVGHNYDGDYNGIYNEYDYITFSMGGFDFEFVIND